jgi:hypothetical protein
MVSNVWLFVLVVAVLGALLGFLAIRPYWRRNRQQSRLRWAQLRFHQQREWLEAKFLTIASQSGKPRGLRWVDCDFEDAVAFARDRGTGNLRALVAVSVQFEAVPGGAMEDVESVQDHKAATVVFRLDGPEWQTDGRTVFNLNPAETIARYEHELETVE